MKFDNLIYLIYKVIQKISLFYKIKISGESSKNSKAIQSTLNFPLLYTISKDKEKSKEFLSERENFWYNLINPSYNIKSILQPFTGSNHYRFGSNVPDFIRLQISNTLKGRKVSESVRANHIAGANKKPVFFLWF